MPDKLAKIVYKVMSKDASGRYRVAGQLGNVLKDFRDRARANTGDAPRANIPPSVSQAPAAASSYSGNRPSAKIPPPPASSEPTARYSAAPMPPQSYNQAAQPAAIPAPSNPQPFVDRSAVQQISPPAQQHYSPAAVPQQPLSGDSGGYSRYSSRPISTMDVENEGPDLVTIALAVLAFIAVAGLCPLALIVISAYT